MTTLRTTQSPSIIFAKLQIESSNLVLNPVSVKTLINEAVIEMFGTIGHARWPVDVLQVQATSILITLPAEYVPYIICFHLIFYGFIFARD